MVEDVVGVGFVVDVDRALPCAADPAVVFERFVGMDLAALFPRWLMVPAIVGARDGVGVWGEVGSSKRLVLDNGGGMDEVVSAVGADHFLLTRLTNFRRSFHGPLLAADDCWRVEAAAGGGSVVHWRWRFYYRRWSLIALVDKQAWGVYMRRVLATQVAVCEAAAQAIEAVTG